MKTGARHHPIIHHDDNLTRAGAEALANTIRAFWFRKGKFPNVSVVGDRPHGFSGGDGKGGVYGVRSNIINGVPQ